MKNLKPIPVFLFASSLVASIATASAESVETALDLEITPLGLAYDLLGQGINVTGMSVDGDSQQFGRFEGYEFLFGDNFSEGVVLGTGDVAKVVASKNENDKLSLEISTNAINDADMGPLVYDLAKLTFNFHPVYEFINIDFVFGSEEYNEFVASDYNDRLEIIINGERCALTPDGESLSVNTVNDRAQYPPLEGVAGPSANAELYINNDPGLSVDLQEGIETESPSVAVYSTQMDGFTKNLNCTAQLVVGEENTLVIGLVDVGDAAYDSWAFIRAGSVYSKPEVDAINPDSDLDGIPDSIEAPNGEQIDTDGDGIADIFDLDSDNDGIPDSIEFQGDLSVDKNRDGLLDSTDNALEKDTAPLDTDNDGTPDYLDLDSDNDNLTDIEESIPAGLDLLDFDANQDGSIDNLSDDDQDGLLDAVDPSVTGSSDAGTPLEYIDVDQDGLVSYRDPDSDDPTINLDYDKDGIPNIFEAPNGEQIDTDGDGIADIFDLDSDNDGIPDSIEYQGTISTDTNTDGLVDTPITEAQLDTAPVDTDGDGMPDYLDLDSDNDSLSDLEESLNPSQNIDLVDANKDGKLDDATDANKDGRIDSTDSVLAKGEPLLDLNFVDLDGDNLLNYRDVDSDGDQFNDDLENADYDKDGTLDRLEKETGLKTAVSGVGIGSLGWVLLWLMPLLVGLRKQGVAK